MNTKTLIAAAALALVGSSAFAQVSESFYDVKPVSTLSRAEVRAEVLRARAAGELPVNSEEAQAQVYAKVAPSTVTRTQVLAELKKARAEGSDVAQIDAPVAYKTDVATARTREEVRAEARAFAKSGQTYGALTAGY